MDKIYTISKDLSELDCQENLKDHKQSSSTIRNTAHEKCDKADKCLGKSRKDELATRLACSLKKLKQYEQCIDAGWSIDMSLFNIKDLPVTDTKLPEHVEENITGIIQSARDYITKLNSQLNALDNADQQIENSVVNTITEIDTVYKTLMDEVCQEINKRRDMLKLEVEVHKNEGLTPLRACRQEVKAQISSTRSLIALVESMLKHPTTFNRERFAQIISASSNIGRIPEVPYSEELPYVTFNRPLKSSTKDIKESISKLGCVMRTGPVQIINVEDRPAGLFISWYITDQEYAGEEHIFVVQRAIGEILDPGSDLFETVYEGPETACFVRGLPINESITLRVRIQTLDVAWSVQRIARTTIPPYSWEQVNKCYMITNNGRIAAKFSNDISTLFSDGPQFDANHIIEFKFLEASQEHDDDEGIALVRDPEGTIDSLKRIGSLMITTGGKIFMDGEEKLMRLPRIHFGTRIILTAMRKDTDTLRINIECSDKGVTYDWRVKTPLHFAARFTEYNKWNLMVK